MARAPREVRAADLQPPNAEPATLRNALQTYPSTPESDTGPVDADGDVPGEFAAGTIYEVSLKRVARVGTMKFLPYQYHYMDGSIAEQLRDDVAVAREIGAKPADVTEE